MATTRYRQALPLLLAGALLLPVLGACDFITGDPTPDEARVVLEGDGAAEVVLLTSSRFLTGRGEDGRMVVQVLGADSATVSPPFDRTFNIRQDQQFFARAIAGDTTGPTDVRMRVLVDDDSKFDESTDLKADTLQFIFLFNRQVLAADVEVL